ncbi:MULTISPECIES: extradiol ring-cleavage dioxygenase [Burkholderia]|uniref:extradiol ring-cleavage dioxygenase n=1 Tax=Burkholderia TaxID=32008 RepID=UPI00078DBF81|nr:MULTISPECIES: extradiol ring-cleavage dioxygenase [Burkholderia]AMU04693.1 extradiol ring-cleavage dioxygenase [Burkholderia cenocepacia]RQS24199.1 extradiol ring-cleavage dioxygenase [Burkholderia sp. Bp8995]RQS37923.1 extradiol ring-cleavage dioxygenase [Burkholderia sp. Bp8989]
MSRNTVERVLHQLCVDRAAKQRFKEAAEQFLDRFQLTDAERAMIVSFDVKGLQEHGVNSMLTMGYWQELSPQRDMRTYMAKLRSVDRGEAVFSAALKG